MRVLPVINATFLLTMVPLIPPASAKDGCPPGMIRECRPQPNPPVKPAQCRCVVDPSASGSGNQGKAEIKQKNVPQVKKSKNPGAND